MFKFFSKNQFSVLLALLSLNTLGSYLMADECCYPTCNRFYIGAFGGGLHSSSCKTIQTGTAFFEEAVGGPLDVDARGHLRKKTAGFGGVQIGYEWLQCPLYVGCSGWNITPAAEIEAYWFHYHRKGRLVNPTDRLPMHDFVNSFSVHTGVYLLNGVLALNNCSCLGKFSPYIGGGIGVAKIFLRRAKSSQVAPPERGINHFNSRRHDSDWAFAAQAKAGIRFNICDRLNLFAEYRFLYVDSSRYIFGSTRYSTHAPTSTWNVDVKKNYNNAFALGFQFNI